jgi:hypothetical protein
MLLLLLSLTCRIEFLAQVRNMALAPLYSHYAANANSRHTSVPAASNSRSSGSSSSSSRPAAPGALPWDPDYVVFLNDVYFCWSMVLRLMGYRADITCGLDFWQNRGGCSARASGCGLSVKFLFCFQNVFQNAAGELDSAAWTAGSLGVSTALAGCC